MANPRTAVKGARTLNNLRASFARAQNQGERMVARLRREAEAFMARSRGEVLKEVRDLERRMLKGLHAATREQVTRLERRIAKLEHAVAELQRPAGTGGEKAA
jgi:polyhydroxyalkanoate synthesis regulator phasin